MGEWRYYAEPKDMTVSYCLFMILNGIYLFCSFLTFCCTGNFTLDNINFHKFFDLKAIVIEDYKHTTLAIILVLLKSIRSN